MLSVAVIGTDGNQLYLYSPPVYPGRRLLTSFYLNPICFSPFLTGLSEAGVGRYPILANRCLLKKIKARLSGANNAIQRQRKAARESIDRKPFSNQTRNPFNP
jgi:hypothetical protein